jgi:hypothetical protein
MSSSSSGAPGWVIVRWSRPGADEVLTAFVELQRAIHKFAVNLIV